MPVDELAHHYGFDPHVGLLRGWALALPVAAVWWLTRPRAVYRARASSFPRPRAGRLTAEEAVLRGPSAAVGESRAMS